MEIKIGIGLDNVFFGIKEDKLIQLLGDPDRINEIDMELPDSRILYYNDQFTKYKFDKNENYRLYSIETYNPMVIMFDKKLIGMKKDALLKLLKEKNVAHLEFEDYYSFEIIHSDQINTTFMIEFDRLTSIEFSPLLLDEDTIQWPN
ncbi:MAG: hypothetical protein JW982_06150 [Spirochaetes bacterium]|nr:hypothetical protein [Spirochaetota bacterium]